MDDTTYQIRRRELLLRLSPSNTRESDYPHIERGEGDVYRARAHYVELFVIYHNLICQQEKKGDFEGAASERTLAIRALEKAVNATPEEAERIRQEEIADFERKYIGF